MNHQMGRIVFGIGVGLLVAWWSYQWITDPSGRNERQLQVSVVEAARDHILAVIGVDSLELVDPVRTDRKVGKVYVYREGDGWSVSGYYRRDEDDRWHPYLMSLDRDLEMQTVKIQETTAELLERAANDPSLEISP